MDNSYFFGRDIINAVKTLFAVLALALTVIGCSNGSTPTMQTNTPKASQPAAATRAPDEAAAIDALRKITEGQTIYFKRNRRFALSFDELVEVHLLTSEPSAAQLGYDFKLRPAADAQTYKLSVVPSDSAANSARSFFADQTGVIHAETGKEATAESPVLK
jgi:hypothetical protein